MMSPSLARRTARVLLASVGKPGVPQHALRTVARALRIKGETQRACGIGSFAEAIVEVAEQGPRALPLGMVDVLRAPQSVLRVVGEIFLAAAEGEPGILHWLNTHEQAPVREAPRP